MGTAESKTYQVKKADDTANLIDNPFGSPKWNDAHVLEDFSYPWENEPSPHMTFKALHNSEWLYCLFEVFDKNITTYVDKNHKSEVVHGDRVEIFLAQDDELTVYYGLEIDAHGRVYDYHASYYRKFEPDWAWPAGHLKVKAAQTQSGYSVLVAVSFQSLRQLGLLEDGKLKAGLFRGKCLQASAANEKMKWISWLKPLSPKPDFHIPSSFGVLHLA